MRRYEPAIFGEEDFTHPSRLHPSVCPNKTPPLMPRQIALPGNQIRNSNVLSAAKNRDGRHEAVFEAFLCRMMSDYTVQLDNDNMTELFVDFYGPKDSPYEAGCWKVRCTLAEAYPYKSPSIGFMNKIFHPNIDEASGTVCLDVINQTWSPMFGIKTLFNKIW